MNLYIFRHGETDWNLKGLMQGHTDIALNSTGITQADSIIPKLKDKNIEFIFSSDLQRARETTEIVSKGLGVNFTFHKEIREANLGVAEGKKIFEISKEYNELFWETKSLANDNFYEFSYPKGERRGDLQSRLLNFVNDTILNSGFRNVCLSIHGAALRYLLLGLSNDEFSEVPIPNCVIYKAHFDKKKWTITGPF